MQNNKAEDFGINIKDKNVAIKLPDSAKYDLNWFQSKYRVVSDLREFANINTIQFIEEYVKKIEPKKDAKKGKETEKPEKTKKTQETKQSKDATETEGPKVTKSTEAKKETSNTEKTKEVEEKK